MTYVPYCLGVDLGKVSDHTAMTVMRRVPGVGTPPSPEEMLKLFTEWEEQFGEKYANGEDCPPVPGQAGYVYPNGYRPSSYQIGGLDRLDLGLNWVDITSKVMRRLSQLPTGTDLVIDKTGVGSGPVDIFRKCGLFPIAVNITPGNSENYDAGKDTYNISKQTLVSNLQAVLHCLRLDLLAGLEHSETLVNELRNFRESATPGGFATWEARSGAHDDLLLSASLALWRLRQGSDDEFLGGGLNVQEFYELDMQRQRKLNEIDPEGADLVAKYMPWREAKPARYVPDEDGKDFENLDLVYWEAYNGLMAETSTNLCYYCHKPLGLTSHSYGVNSPLRWHPTCPTPDSTNAPRPSVREDRPFGFPKL